MCLASMTLLLLAPLFLSVCAWLEPVYGTVIPQKELQHSKNVPPAGFNTNWHPSSPKTARGQCGQTRKHDKSVVDLLMQVDIAALSETPFSQQGQLEEVGASYTFFWSGLPKAERHGAGVAFAIWNDIVGCLPCLPQGINDLLMSRRLPLWGEQFTTIISAYAPPNDDL
ncbi:unnamed protein product [Schistocephalus solidus]|uniref:Endo/exonuclease/phosphatase domain-containing protein n=1 Tax=Schistocephalus solidus TaxID=70667 RepID=A0A183SIJ0_SCHSO|nr:unnamed protein product [Schistocephalus solidus]